MDCATFQFVNLLYVFVLLIHTNLIFLFNQNFFHRRFILKYTLTLASKMTETNLKWKNLFLTETTVNENRGRAWDKLALDH